MSQTTDNSGTVKGARCPICSRPSGGHYRPFCSKRCADIDLSRWLSGSYVISGASASDDGDEDGLGLPVPPAANDDD